jgi:uncharacterized protein (TIGR03435 family)
MIFPNGRARLAAQQKPVNILTQTLRTSLGRPIIDKTGLTSLYDFTLDFDPRPTAGASPWTARNRRLPTSQRHPAANGVKTRRCEGAL